MNLSHKKDIRTVLQTILNAECPGVYVSIQHDNVEKFATEIRFCGPTVKSLWIDHSMKLEQIGERCRFIIDEFITEARALEAEHLDEIYDYDS